MAGWATGGTLLAADVLSWKPTVRIGGTATNAVNAMRAVAGSGIVLLAWLAGIFLLPRRGLHGLVREAFSFFAAIELLGWFLSATVHATSPQANDAGKFLAITGAQPWAVAAISALLLAVGVVIAKPARKTVKVTAQPAAGPASSVAI